MSLRTLVMIPTVNEAENIVTVVTRARRALPEASVLVIDGASADGTPDLAAALDPEVGSVHVLRQAERNGLGGAYREGFAWGLQNGFDVMIEMDADLSHDPSDLPSLLEKVEGGARLAIGSRYVPGGSTPDWKPHRRLLSRAGNLYTGVMLRMKVRDATAGFRAYRDDTLAAIDYATTKAGGYGFQVEMTYRVAQTGGAIVEVPIVFRDRELGHSKMHGGIVVEAIALVTWWGIRDRVRRRLPR